MARGGKRPGAGRPKGSTVDKYKENVEQRPKFEGVETPLEYMLEVMRDPHAEWRRRDDMAKAAAPYCHEKKNADAPTKKQERQDNAEKSASSGLFAAPSAPNITMN